MRFALGLVLVLNIAVEEEIEQKTTTYKNCCLNFLAKLCEFACQQYKDHTGLTPILLGDLCGLLFVASCRHHSAIAPLMPAKIVLVVVLGLEPGAKTTGKYRLNASDSWA